MELTTPKSSAQLFKSRIVLFPNEEQSTQPTSAKRVGREYGVLPYHAKLIAELQGYDLGGA